MALVASGENSYGVPIGRGAFSGRACHDGRPELRSEGVDTECQVETKRNCDAQPEADSSLSRCASPSIVGVMIREYQISSRLCSAAGWKRGRRSDDADPRHRAPGASAVLVAGDARRGARDT
jgi:hypothetical protein